MVRPVQVPSELSFGQRYTFVGPDGKLWTAWREREDNSHNYMEGRVGDGEDDDYRPVFELKPHEHRSFWTVRVHGSLDAGESIIVPALDDGHELASAAEAFTLGWLCWLAYLDYNRRCPFCGEVWGTEIQKMDGTLPTHANKLGDQNAVDGEGNCIGSGAFVEELLGEGIYQREGTRRIMAGPPVVLLAPTIDRIPLPPLESPPLEPHRLRLACLEGKC